MFVFNIKVNGSKIFKYFFLCVIFIFIIILGIVMYRVFSGANDASYSQSCTPKNSVSQISAKNYTNVLKAVHENIDDYVGLKINFTGYVYRVYDFTETQFVLARNMVISSDNQTLVVGFLCNYSKANEFSDNTWVNITGKITKGDYHGDIPIIEITSMKQCDKPADEYVYPPDDTYIPTSALF